MKKRTIFVILSLMLFCLISPAGVSAVDSPCYYDPFEQTVKYPNCSCEQMEDLYMYGPDGSTCWYYVGEDITIDHNIIVRGDVRFIIDAKMQVNGKIDLDPVSSLSLYCTQASSKDGAGLIAYAINAGEFSNITIYGGNVRCVNTSAGTDCDMLGGKGAEVVINGGKVMVMDNYCSSALDLSAIGGENSKVRIELHNEDDYVQVVYSSSFKSCIGGKNSEVNIRSGNVGITRLPGDNPDDICRNKVIGIGGVNSTVNIYDHLGYSFVEVPTDIRSEGFDNGVADVSGSGEAIGGSGSKVNIAGGIIYAVAGDYSTAVGGNNSTIKISDCCDSSFIGGLNPTYGGAAIGGNGSNITISGGSFNATTYSNSAAIGSCRTYPENKAGSATVRITASSDKDLSINSVFEEGACPDAAIGSGKGGRSVVTLDGESGKAFFDFSEKPASTAMFGGIGGQSTVNIYASPDESSPAYQDLPKVSFVISPNEKYTGKLICHYVPTAKFTLPNVSRSGKTFFGFYDNPHFTGSTVTSTYSGSDLTLYPRFVTPYIPTTGSLIYNTNGGTINEDHPTTYVYGKGIDLPTDVTKEGYTFAGWYTSALSDRLYSISPEDKGCFILYAKWKEGAPAAAVIKPSEPVPASGQQQSEQTPGSSGNAPKEPKKELEVTVRASSLKTSIAWDRVAGADLYNVFNCKSDGSYEYMSTVLDNSASERFMFLDLTNFTEAHTYLVLAIGYDENDTEFSDPIVISAVEITIEVPQAAIGTFGNKAQMITSPVALVNQASALASSELNKSLIAAISSASGGGSTFVSKNGGHSKQETG